jgi:hypothetical protein
MKRFDMRKKGEKNWQKRKNIYPWMFEQEPPVTILQENSHDSYTFKIDHEKIECPICMEEIEQFCKYEHDGTEKSKEANEIVLYCKHRFHKDCLATWIAYKKKETGTNVFPCPYCKKKYVVFHTRNHAFIGEFRKIYANPVWILFLFWFILSALTVFIAATN